MILFAAIAATLATPGTSVPAPQDLEVVGRLVKNVGYRSVDIPDDTLGHGWIAARFRITRVLRGTPPARLLTIRYFAHAALVENSKMRVWLRPGADGAYIVCAPPGDDGIHCAR